MWRRRLAAVELLDAAAAAGRLDEPIDVIVATSLLSVADLRALLPARLRGVPMVLYMHENQAAYPFSEQPTVEPQRDVHFAITNLTSILAADLVIWNSRWNRDSFLEGMESILSRANAVDLRCWREKVEARDAALARSATATSAGAGRFDPQMAAYQRKLKALLYANWVGAQVFRGRADLNARFQVQIDPSGGLGSVALVGSSGNRYFDESAERAIWKTRPFPRPPRGALTLTLDFDPKESL